MRTADEEWDARHETNLVDKSEWLPGPWHHEPDRIEWRYHRTPRFPLLIVRSHSMGALCGYVGVPPGHPDHGGTVGNMRNERKVVADYDVHGGLTYAASCDEAGLICHVPLSGESPDVWWLGFDCGHAWDVMPAMQSRLARIGVPSLGEGFPRVTAESFLPPAEYRAVFYVREQVEKLAEQLARAARGAP